MAWLGRYGPPLAVMALIWVLSDIPNLSSGTDFDTPLRKAAHMTVFGTLHLLWWRAEGPVTAVLVAAAWAALDEHHQSWVQGRHGAVSDVAIDLAGMGLATLLALYGPPALRRRFRPTGRSS